ncbi:MAG: DNA polymerase III subunit delta' [Acidimicrobiia bacterium]
MWEAAVGQEAAVALLQRAALRPVHAYLFVGPRGSGAEDVARSFAAALVNPEGDPAVSDRVHRGRHPDVIEIDPPEQQIRVEHAEAVIHEASTSPVESERKVIVMFEADRMNPSTANKLLKTLEEPSARTVLLLVTASPDDLLPTVRSRCQRIDLTPLSEATVREALVAEGIEPERARLAARLAGGRLDRGRSLAGRLGPLRDAFVVAAGRLDGTGAVALRMADELAEAIAESVAALRLSHELETDELDHEIERAAYPDRAAQALRKRLVERHKRADRRGRIDALLEGITALETVYRDALVPAEEARNVDRPGLVLSPRAAAEALDACRSARESMEFNPNEAILLERLVLRLPASGGRRDGG